MLKYSLLAIALVPSLAFAQISPAQQMQETQNQVLRDVIADLVLRSVTLETRARVAEELLARAKSAKPAEPKPAAEPPKESGP